MTKVGTGRPLADNFRFSGETVEEWIERCRKAGHDALGVANDPEWPTNADVGPYRQLSVSTEPVDVQIAKLEAEIEKIHRSFRNNA